MHLTLLVEQMNVQFLRNSIRSFEASQGLRAYKCESWD